MEETKLREVLQALMRIDAKLDTALGQLSDHEGRLCALENIGGKRWDALLTQVLSLLAAAGIGLFLGGLI